TYNLIKKTLNPSNDTKLFLFKNLFSKSKQKLIKENIKKIDDNKTILIVDLNTKKTKKFSHLNTYHHFMCPCDTYKNVNFDKHVGDYAIIKAIQIMNSEILHYLKHSYFKNNYVYFTYFYNPLSVLNEYYHETDLGIGIAPKRSIAKIKSVMESIERYAIFLPQCSTGIEEIDNNAFCLIKENKRTFHKSSSNGFAASPNIEMAKNNALNELLERDSLMTSWIYNKNIRKIDNNTLPTFFQNYIVELELKEYSTYIYQLDKHKNIYCFLIITINMQNEPFIKSGIGSHDSSKSEALNKAFGELLIGIFFDYKFPSKTSTQGSDFHLNYYRSHRDSEQKLKNMESLLTIENSVDWSNIVIDANTTDLKKTEFFNYTINDGVFNNVSIVKASQSNFYPIFFKGFEREWCEMYFDDKEIRILNNKPHPFP
ncbi:TPA: YcaO-like family protein, partial [Staphylococcus pseudintermedius]|nr:YcaO-like family protein [Staphylococcus pseudintermedius]